MVVTRLCGTPASCASRGHAPGALRSSIQRADPLRRPVAIVDLLTRRIALLGDRQRNDFGAAATGERHRGGRGGFRQR